MQTGLPDTREWPLLGAANLRNTALLLAAPIPAVVSVWTLFHWFPHGAIPQPRPWDQVDSAEALAAFLVHHPLLTLNLVYFVFGDLQLWAIALLQRSSWLIDPYWTLLPVLIAWFYLAHPLAGPSGPRWILSSIALVVWSVRLTWSYFRRESWRCGLREDWRYARMRRERPGFWWQQFFVVYVAQHLMLVGLSLPFWAISFRPAPFGVPDVVCFAAALLGIALARRADVELDRFMRANRERDRRGEPRVWLLDSGLWRWSRHPNYVGEQLFWWSIAGFGVVCGEPWVVVGSALNSCVLAAVTAMTERRMLEVRERRDAYAAYRRRTAVWIPWPRRSGAGNG